MVGIVGTVAKGLDQGAVDIAMPGLSDQGFRAFSQLPGQGLGLCAGSGDDAQCHRVTFQGRRNVLRIFQQPDRQVAVVVSVSQAGRFGNQRGNLFDGLVHILAIRHMDVFLHRLFISLDNQGKQSAETFLGRGQDHRRKAHHFAEGFIIQRMAGGQEPVVTGKGKHGPGIHIDQSGSEPEAVVQGHGIDDIQHHGRLVGENLPADVHILSAIVHETDDIIAELDRQLLPA